MKLKTYRYRAECSADSEKLDNILCGLAGCIGLKVLHLVAPLVAGYPDVLGTLQINVGLSDLRGLMGASLMGM